MNVLAEKLAELLDIGVERAVELYPIIRGQMIAYNITHAIITVLMMLTIVTIAASILSVSLWVFNHVDYGADDKDCKFYKKLSKVFVPLSLVSLVLLLSAYAAQNILSPDYMFIRTMLGGN